jgi:hypothetical protein
MADDPKKCLRCGADLVISPDSRVRCCLRCGTPHARHDLPPEKFPFTLKLVSGTTGEVVWSRTVTIDEARNLAKVEIPSFTNSDHYPVRAEIEYADGTTDVRGMQ